MEHRESGYYLWYFSEGAGQNGRGGEFKPFLLGVNGKVEELKADILNTIVKKRGITDTQGMADMLIALEDKQKAYTGR